MRTGKRAAWGISYMVLCLCAGVNAFSEGLKGVAQTGDDEYFGAHHDANVIIRFTNTSTTIVAGSESGEPGDRDGQGVNALLHGPQGMVFDQHNSIYFTDTYNDKLKKLDINTFEVTTVTQFGPPCALNTTKQQGWFPIMVDMLAGGQEVFVSMKKNLSIYSVDLRTQKNSEIKTDCKWASPHGISISAARRVLVADDAGGIKMIDLTKSEAGIHICETLSGSSERYYSFRDVSWIDNSTALMMERNGPGTIYAWDVDTNASSRICGGGGSGNNSNNHCWRDGVGVVTGHADGIFWKAMHIDYKPKRWPGRILVADTGANFLRRVSVRGSDLLHIGAADVTTVPCFNTSYRFSHDIPPYEFGTKEHAICGKGDGPSPFQLGPCDACMNESLGTWCSCGAYTSAPWCLDPPPTPPPPAPTPVPRPPAPSPPQPPSSSNFTAVDGAVCEGNGEQRATRYYYEDHSVLQQCLARCSSDTTCLCANYAQASASKTSQNECRLNNESRRTKQLPNATSHWVSYVKMDND